MTPPAAAAARIRTFGAFRAALAAPSARTPSGLRDALLRYDGRDIMQTARWQKFVASTPFVWARTCAPYATTLVDTDELRARILYWSPGSVMPFHDHPGYELVGMRVLGGSPLQEHVRQRGSGVATFRRELVVGDVSVIPGTDAEHRIRVKFDDMSTQTLSVELLAAGEGVHKISSADE